jgi:hypothetical protein
VRTAATIGLLEGLQNVALAGQVDPAPFEARLGPESSRWWRELEAFWAGEIPFVGAGATTGSTEGRPGRFEVTLDGVDPAMPSQWTYEFPAAVATSHEQDEVAGGFEPCFRYQVRRVEGPRWQRRLDAEAFERERDRVLARLSSGAVDAYDRSLRASHIARWAADLEWRDVPEAHQALVEACYQRWRASAGEGEPPPPDAGAS